MIKHLVLLKFKAEATDNDIADLEQSVGALPAVIPEIKGYEFGRDVVRTEKSYDFALVSAFDTLEAVKRYQVHPAHQVAAGKARSLSESMVLVDFEFR